MSSDLQSQNSKQLIDWYSFTVPTLDYETERTHVAIVMSQKSLKAYLPEFEETFGDIGQWERCKSRSPYQIAMMDGKGVTVFCSPTMTNILVEVSGRGCERLGEYLLLLIGATYDRCSRIDLAVDLETEITPPEFVDAGYSDRFRSKSTVKSVTGETVYIGSRKSERYCRVYRYAHPHPRSKYMRIEYVYRKKVAKIVAEKIVKHSLSEVIMSSHDRYGWEHGLLEGLHGDIDLSRYVPERTKAGTLRWLLVQVAPAFKKLVETGAIDDPEAFLRKYFLDEGEVDNG